MGRGASGTRAIHAEMGSGVRRVKQSGVRMRYLDLLLRLLREMLLDLLDVLAVLLQQIVEQFGFFGSPNCLTLILLIV